VRDSWWAERMFKGAANNSGEAPWFWWPPIKFNTLPNTAVILVMEGDYKCTSIHWWYQEYLFTDQTIVTQLCSSFSFDFWSRWFHLVLLTLTDIWQQMNSTCMLPFHCDPASVHSQEKAPSYRIQDTFVTAPPTMRSLSLYSCVTGDGSQRLVMTHSVTISLCVCFSTSSVTNSPNKTVVCAVQHRRSYFFPLHIHFLVLKDETKKPIDIKARRFPKVDYPGVCKIV